MGLRQTPVRNTGWTRLKKEATSILMGRLKKASLYFALAVNTMP